MPSKYIKHPRISPGRECHSCGCTVTQYSRGYKRRMYPQWIHNIDIKNKRTTLHFLCRACYSHLIQLPIYRPRLPRDEIERNRQVFAEKRKGTGNPMHGRSGIFSPSFGRKYPIELRTRMAEIRRGERGPSWQGGKTKLILSIRSCLQYDLWRFSVYRRDANTCQRTSCRNPRPGNKRLVAHHIKQLAQIISEYELKTLDEALECPEIWAVSNGQTLCLECHKQTDSYSWKSSNRFKKYYQQKALSLSSTP